MDYIEKFIMFSYVGSLFYGWSTFYAFYCFFGEFICIFVDDLVLWRLKLFY